MFKRNVLRVHMRGVQKKRGRDSWVVNICIPCLLSHRVPCQVHGRVMKLLDLGTNWSAWRSRPSTAIAKTETNACVCGTATSWGVTKVTTANERTASRGERPHLLLSIALCVKKSRSEGNVDSSKHLDQPRHQRSIVEGTAITHTRGMLRIV